MENVHDWNIALDFAELRHKYVCDSAITYGVPVREYFLARRSKRKKYFGMIIITHVAICRKDSIRVVEKIQIAVNPDTIPAEILQRIDAVKSYAGITRKIRKELASREADRIAPTVLPATIKHWRRVTEYMMLSEQSADSRREETAPDAVRAVRQRQNSLPADVLRHHRHVKEVA